jgi:tellurite resistance protein TerC
MTVPAWAWAAFIVFVVAVLLLDLFVLHRHAQHVSLAEAAAWSAVWIAVGLGFGALLWSWRGGDVAQAYLAGYLIEKSLSLDNVFVFTVIFSMFAIPPRYQQRVLMAGIIGALAMRAAFIAGGSALLHSFHAAVYVFGAVLLWTALRMLRPGGQIHPGRSVPRLIQRVLPATDQLHGQRFLVRERGRWVATPLLTALIVVEAADVMFAVDSIPAIFAVTTDPFVVFTSNVFAILGLRALYVLLAGAVGRFRFLRAGLSLILAGAAVKLLLSDIYAIPVWASPAFIASVLAVVAVMSVLDARRRPAADRGRESPARDRARWGPAEGTRQGPHKEARQGSHEGAGQGLREQTGEGRPREPVTVAGQAPSRGGPGA